VRNAGCNGKVWGGPIPSPGLILPWDSPELKTGGYLISPAVAAGNVCFFHLEGLTPKKETAEYIDTVLLGILAHGVTS